LEKNREKAARVGGRGEQKKKLLAAQRPRIKKGKRVNLSLNKSSEETGRRGDGGNLLHYNVTQETKE